MWYNAAIGFMLVEINARSYTQMIVMVCIYIFNAIVNAVLFGIFVEQFQIIRRKESDYQEKIDNSNSAMFDAEIPRELQDKIRKYFEQINET